MGPPPAVPGSPSRSVYCLRGLGVGEQPQWRNPDNADPHLNRRSHGAHLFRDPRCTGRVSIGSCAARCGRVAHARWANLPCWFNADDYPGWGCGDCSTPRRSRSYAPDDQGPPHDRRGPGGFAVPRPRVEGRHGHDRVDRAGAERSTGGLGGEQDRSPPVRRGLGAVPDGHQLRADDQRRGRGQVAGLHRRTGRGPAVRAVRLRARARRGRRPGGRALHQRGVPDAQRRPGRTRR